MHILREPCLVAKPVAVSAKHVASVVRIYQGTDF